VTADMVAHKRPALFRRGRRTLYSDGATWHSDRRLGVARCSFLSFRPEAPPPGGAVAEESAYEYGTAWSPVRLSAGVCETDLAGTFGWEGSIGPVRDQISPLRCAPVEMTQMERCARTEMTGPRGCGAVDTTEARGDGAVDMTGARETVLRGDTRRPFGLRPK
jgi:hypothetical protein